MMMACFIRIFREEGCLVVRRDATIVPYQLDKHRMEKRLELFSALFTCIAAMLNFASILFELLTKAIP